MSGVLTFSTSVCKLSECERFPCCCSDERKLQTMKREEWRNKNIAGKLSSSWFDINSKHRQGEGYLCVAGSFYRWKLWDMSASVMRVRCAAVDATIKSISLIRMCLRVPEDWIFMFASRSSSPLRTEPEIIKRWKTERLAVIPGIFWRDCVRRAMRSPISITERNFNDPIHLQTHPSQDWY